MSTTETATEFALEGAPIHECNRVSGKLYASHPTFDTLDEAKDVQESVFRRSGPPRVRILTRSGEGAEWVPHAEAP